MAEKYPQYTPFNYTLGNPIRLVDPDGMEVDDIIISHDGKDYKYENGKLYIGGLEYKEKQSGFLMKTVNALNSIGSTAEGGTMLSELQSSSIFSKFRKVIVNSNRVIMIKHSLISLGLTRVAKILMML